MAQPLMFSFSEEISSTETINTSLSMRVGNGLHNNGKPQFCSKFYLQPGSAVRRLRVAPQDSRRVDTVYVIGIEDYNFEASGTPFLNSGAVVSITNGVKTVYKHMVADSISYSKE